MKSQLMLHQGARHVTLRELANTPTPKRTKTHVPISHIDAITTVLKSLQDNQFEVIDARHGLSKDNNRYFGLINMRHPDKADNDSGWAIGCRNSHDKKFGYAVTAASQVFVCDNLAMSGKWYVSRKHTSHIEDIYRKLVEDCIPEIKQDLVNFDKREHNYKNVHINNGLAADIILTAARKGVITSTDILKVDQSWRHPQHEQFEDKTIWSLYNAFTESQKRLSNPNLLNNRQGVLHDMLDMFTSDIASV